ncbi:hypothetical protein JW978_01525 [Candidatus Dojkabacteria bacterium]|nr:hypothetical protein [Candidatus Dojkabacteria bacterium]
MRTAAIFALLTVFFGFVFFFLLDNQPPLDFEKLSEGLASEEIDTQTGTIAYINESIELGILSDYINYPNLMLVGAFFSAAIFSGLSTFQIMVDKMFFRKFYESPRYLVAYRRSGLVVALIDSLILLRVFLGFDLAIAGTIILLFVIIEGFLSFGTRKQKTEEVQKVAFEKTDSTKESGVTV